MKEIRVGASHVALVDDNDYELVSQYAWRLRSDLRHRTNYAVTGQLRMHKLITGFHRTDHINGNGLDNRRENLREANQSQNMANVTKYRGEYSSQFKGVYWNKQHGKWMAQIYVSQKKRFLGIFTDETEAAKAYDRAAIEYFGEFARPNFSP